MGDILAIFVVKMKHPIQLIRAGADREEIDYLLVKSCLQGYAAPRDVVTRLLRAGDLLRVKKGLYVFGPDHARRPYSLEILANIIYGPSYISCHYALQHYGFIPETVVEVTSMTTERNKLFNTPVGRFRYRYLHLSKYNIGITRREIIDNIYVLMATPEKALADLLYTNNESTDNLDELRAILYDDYRLEPSNIGKLRINAMSEVVQAYQHATISLLPQLIREEKKNA